MKKFRYLFIIVALMLLAGCTAMDATKDGVASTYGGVKTVGSDIFAGLGKVLAGGGIGISITTNAAYNDDVKQTTVIDGKVAEPAVADLSVEEATDTPVPFQ